MRHQDDKKFSFSFTLIGAGNSGQDRKIIMAKSVIMEDSMK
jgi:hypothetical protein